jgi:hypothetical protein
MTDVAVVMLGHYTWIDISLFGIYLYGLRYIGRRLIILLLLLLLLLLHSDWKKHIVFLLPTVLQILQMHNMKIAVLVVHSVLGVLGMKSVHDVYGVLGVNGVHSVQRVYGLHSVRFMQRVFGVHGEQCFWFAW